MSALELEGRRVTVMGLGLFGGGAGVARHLVRRGARVTVTDLRDAATLAPTLAALDGLELEFVLGRHRHEDFRDTGLVVVNPAVPRSSEYLTVARAAGVPITSETALFLDATPARVAAITGTQGKSSTSNYLAQLLNQSGLRAHLGGNIGGSLLDELDLMEARDVCVLELSSYQLETLADESARRGATSPVECVAIVNVLADHLERHGSVAEYARAKRRILELARPGGTAFLHASAHVEFDAGREPAVARALATLHQPELPDVRSAPASLPDFQRENLRFAVGAARALGASAEALDAALANLNGLPHRLERLAPVDGHAIWDNAVSTTPDSTVSALRALPPIGVLLAGGRPKAGLDPAELIEVARVKVRAVVLFGELATAWGPSFRVAGVATHAASDLAAGIKLAFSVLEPGAALLFSPAAASFDAWPNWVARAQAFRDALTAGSSSVAGRCADRAR